MMYNSKKNRRILLFKSNLVNTYFFIIVFYAHKKNNKQKKKHVQAQLPFSSFPKVSIALSHVFNVPMLVAKKFRQCWLLLLCLSSLERQGIILVKISFSMVPQ